MQNVHYACSTNVPVIESVLSRPKRIRKRKRLYGEEPDMPVKPKRTRKKRLQPSFNVPILTDAEIERQFGERLSPEIKPEQSDELQLDVIEPEPVVLTPIERARAQLKNVLGRKLRSRQNSFSLICMPFPRWSRSGYILAEDPFA